MTSRVGVLRHAAGLAEAAAADRQARRRGGGRGQPGRLGDHEPAHDQRRAHRRRRPARGDPRLALARGLPRARRRRVGGPLRHRDDRRRDHGRVRPGTRHRRTPPGDSPVIARTPYDALPPALLEELSGAGLDPKAIYDAVAAAVAEDLPGDDVTSAATIPATARGVADFAAREPGVVAGLGRGRPGLPLRDGRGRRDHRPARRRHPGAARRRGDARRRPGPGAAHRRAHRPQLRQPPLRGGHRDRGLGRRPGRHPRPGPRHPQDAARRTAPCRSTPCAAAAA